MQFDLESAGYSLPLKPGILTYQSPLPVFRPLELPSLLMFPAAVEAKLAVNGEGMVLWYVDLRMYCSSSFDRGSAEESGNQDFPQIDRELEPLRI